MSAKIQMREPIESGCPDGFQYMHPVMRRNYGQWLYHEDPRPGV
ncbi:MAG: Dissimilatory sulfite reductase, beta subunit (EC, partial [uncultured Thiotrichaceae bacterium]